MARRNNEAISAAEANRNFSELLRGVRDGKSFIVTTHGKPVAKLIPFEADVRAHRPARRALFARLAAGPVVDVGKWARESLYEDEK